MKKFYEAPEFEIVLMAEEDVVTTSYVPGPNDGELDEF